MNPGDWVTPAWAGNRYGGEPSAEVLPPVPADMRFPEPTVRARDLYSGNVFVAPARDFRVVKTVEERMAEELMG
ncbi:MAG TPA: hypothetical protein VMZ50_08380 [Phycisphaerae bacterium]|nr:hypothetical protein [Phycisphaerae bacterium]